MEVVVKREQFEILVERLEQEAQRQPALYRARLGAMALLGYGYIAAILALLCLALALLIFIATRRSGAAIAIKLGILLVPLIWAVLRAMAVKLDPPSGRAVHRHEAPELFACIDEVQSQAGAPKAHEVLVTDDFNAAVVQHARWGMFGWPRNYLILGLPLMQALDLKEFRAVLAHEFGHLSGAHGKFGAWIYRLRTGWTRLTQALERDDHWGKALFVPFFSWYAPAFSALSFVQARRQEYEADRVSAAVAGANIAAQALIRVHVQSRFLERHYWRRILRQADTDAEPQVQPFTMLRTAFVEQRVDDDAQSALRSALKRRTGCDDTHPSLSDRLAALRCSPHLPGPVDHSAADALLGSLAERLTADFDARWRESVSAWWQGRHQYALASKSKLAELANADEELCIEDAFNRAELTEELGDEAGARQQLETLAKRAPEHAATQFALGRMRLNDDDESGIALLKNAMRLDPGAEQASCRLIVEYLQRHGRNEEARSHIDLLHDAGTRDQAASKERGELRIADKLLPHGLAEKQVADLTIQLQAVPELRRVYLVRKQTVHYQDVPMYVLAFERRMRFWKLERSGAMQALADRLSREISCPGETIIIGLDGDNRVFRRKFRAVAGAQLALER